jgi:3-methyladenine DNA glycosylase Tag
MNDASKKKFMNAIFGEEGTQIDSSTAAALLAATCSGGNPEVGNKLAELLVPEMDEKVDPSMMAALMSACSLINAGANTDEVMNVMKLELAASGLSEEEILAKTQLLMKAFGKEEEGSTAEYKLLSKQKNKALVKAEMNPKDFTAIVLAHKALGACGVSPENIAKMLIIMSTLGKKGANMDHVAVALKNLGAISE